MDNDDLKSLYSEYERLFDDMNDSLEELIADREKIKLLRKKCFVKEELSSDLEKLMGSHNYGDGNLVYKILQRYGYMKILTEIKELFEKRGIDMSSLEEDYNILQ